MHDDPIAAERRRQFANTLFIVAGFSAARGLMEMAWNYATRQVSWHDAFIWTTPSWLILLPLGAGTVAMASRFSFERHARVQSVVVHTLACAAFCATHLVFITPFRVLNASEPMTSERHLSRSRGRALFHPIKLKRSSRILLRISTPPVRHRSKSIGHW